MFKRLDSKSLCASVAIGIVLAASSERPVRATGANAVIEWNQIAVNTALAIGQGPLPQMRAAAITAVAMSDAANGITREFRRYGSVLPAPAGASSTAAVIAAAFRSLTVLYPSRAGNLAQELDASLAKYQVSRSDPGFAYGTSVADHLLALRASDGSAQAQFPYTAPGAGAPGVWVQTPPGFLPAALPGWRDVQPWV